MFIQSIIEYFQKLFQKLEKPQTYGSALEEYIVRNAPQNSFDVDRLTRQFDLNQSGRGW